MAPGSWTKKARGRGRFSVLARVRKAVDGVGRVRRRRAAMSCE